NETSAGIDKRYPGFKTFLRQICIPRVCNMGENLCPGCATVKGLINVDGHHSIDDIKGLQGKANIVVDKIKFRVRKRGGSDYPGRAPITGGKKLTNFGARDGSKKIGQFLADEICADR